MENARNLGKNGVGCTGRTLVGSIFRYSFVCLHCAVPVSVYCRLCLVTVRMEILRNGRLSDFQRGQFVGARLAGESVTKTATLFNVSTAAVVMIDGIHKSWEDVIRYGELWPKTKTK